MISRSSKRLWTRIAAVGGITLATGLVTFRAQADEWDKQTTITIDQPVQITDTYLEPGTYVLRLLRSNLDRHIVQVYDANQTHVIDTVLAIPNYRIQPTGNSRFMFWETPPGTARALRAWFYPGDNFGQEFRYPAHPRQLAVALNTPAPAPEPANVTTPEPSAAAAEPAPAEQPAQPAEQATVNNNPEPANPPEQDQTVIAQNTNPQNTPPNNVPDTVAPANNNTQPNQLPKTASPFPLAGLGGLFSLSLFGVARLRRCASHSA